MIKKFVSIKNVGRYRDCRAHGDVDLKKNTLVLGANGVGKTTICSILRSLNTNDPSHIIGRKTIDSRQQPFVELIVDGRLRRFDGMSWSENYPHLAIFDSEFVTQNVHSGEVVEIDQRRNLYRVIIGDAGVQLASEESNRVKKGRKKMAEVRAVANEIRARVPQGMAFEEFMSLPVDPEIDTKIDDQEQTLRTLRDAQQISTLSALTAFDLPRLPDGFRELLAKTIDDIAEDAETRLAEHVSFHRMGTAARKWIAEGLQHGNDASCPFCGQDIRNRPLIRAYRAVFSQEYEALRQEIRSMRREIEERFGEGAVGRLTTLAAQNQGAVEIWRRYCDIGPAPLDLPDAIPEAIRELRIAGLALLELKSQRPLNIIRCNASDFSSAVVSFREAESQARVLASGITEANAVIDVTKRKAGSTNESAAYANLARLKAIKLRHYRRVAELCAIHGRLTSEKHALDQQKNQIRACLNTHTANVIAPYEERINDYLESFNAGFRIRNTRHSYQGGQAASRYQLVINDREVDLGDGRTPNDVPSFMNTLSAGDRTTLALAFFLTSVSESPDRSAKTIVFDDPFSSQDTFRRSRTIYAIVEMARHCSQAITLSHDPHFLKEIWDKVSPAERVTLNLVDQLDDGTKIVPIDIAIACRGATARDVAALQAFYNRNEGDPVDICRAMRTVLEHYLWTIYPDSFMAHQDTLGAMTEKIRAGGASHPAASLYPRLNQINMYSRPSHHGEDPASATSIHIDPQELRGFVRDTLQIAHNLHA